MLTSVLSRFGLNEEKYTISPFGKGLINNTWLVKSGNKNYILQRINHLVFTQPENIAHNIRCVADYLKTKHPDYLFITTLQTDTGEDIVHTDDGYFRIFPFVEDSHTYDIVATASQAYEAASAFGKFTRLLSGFDSS